MTPPDTAMPETRKPLPAALATLLSQLDKSQWWPAAQLEKMQLGLAARLLRHARDTSPFYRQRFGDLELPENGRLSSDAWSRIPVLSRSELQAADETLFSTQIPQGHGAASRISTSGSTGKPVTVLTTAVTRTFWQAFTLREHLWHARDFSLKLGSIRIPGDKEAQPGACHSLPDWGVPATLLFRTGPGAMLNIQTPVEQQAQWLLREQPNYLLTFPTNALALARHFADKGLALHSLRQVRTLSESLPEELRQMCRQAWDAEVVDMYSSREAGYLAFQCPQHPHYHVQSESVLLEVLDEQGRQCAPGEIGRVVITPLHNFASPLIRYDIGDYAEVGEACPCGRGLPVLRRILGRVRNMLLIPGQGMVWPRLPGSPLRDAAPVIQSQMVQREPDLIVARLVTERALTDGEEARLTELIRKRLGYPFRVNFEYPEKIERSPAGKFEEFRSEI